MNLLDPEASRSSAEICTCHTPRLNREDACTICGFPVLCGGCGSDCEELECPCTRVCDEVCCYRHAGL